ncbi:PRC-barrel domain-containing protein [Allobranchiibius sp. GilTou38]|uniref:PRC-barrel domain-containing protein n=1 Tax=Allobranchiibius sp. GilTou38 TaxID=2815210 RepID=UPI001AA0B950|nr:PRC-barrel domain-containing protein [Allobranchiibius sp. GilTou38]MBO1765758.1 PRC-barrel domain-containing protein [Allobranchiibius sp. GilTou38]
MRFKKATGRKVVSLATAETVGKVSRFVIDVPQRRIAALVLRKTDKHGEILTWSDVTGFGDDAVTVADVGVLSEADGPMKELSDKDYQLMGKRVLSTRGDDLGEVKDVDFDPGTGLLETIHYPDGSARGDALVGIGTYAAVIDVD